MSSWHNKGIHTAQEIAEKDTRTSSGDKSSVSRGKERVKSAPNQDEINYMQRVLDKTKKGS